MDAEVESFKEFGDLFLFYMSGTTTENGEACWRGQQDKFNECTFNVIDTVTAKQSHPILLTLSISVVNTSINNSRIYIAWSRFLMRLDGFPKGSVPVGTKIFERAAIIKTVHTMVVQFLRSCKIKKQWKKTSSKLLQEGVDKTKHVWDNVHR